MSGKQVEINRLMRDAFLGRISRREVIRRGVALGMSSSLIVALADRNGSMAQDASPAAEQPMGWSITAPPNLRTDLAGQSITVILGADGPVVPWEERAVQVFSEATGITVNRISGPESATDRLTTLQQVLGAGSSDFDVAQIDVIWPGILASHALDLKPALDSQGYPYFDRIVNNNTVNGVLVGIPWFTDAGLMYYRTDLVEAAGGTEAPKTWSDIENWSNAIQESQRANNPDFQGFVWQGAAYEGLTCDALEWQVSQGGGKIIEDDGTVSVNNPNAIAAFERAKGWVGTISPSGVTTYMEEDSRGVWQAGNAAFMRNWPYAYSLGQADDSVIKGKFDVTLVPMGEGEGAQHADTLGGWQMFASKYSQAPDAAIEFCKFMTSKELQKSFAVEHSRLPTIPELYDDPDVLAVNEFFGRLKDVFLGGAVARPSTVSADLYNEVSTAYFTAVNEILTGQAADAAARVEQLAGQLEEIMSEL